MEENVRRIGGLPCQDYASRSSRSSARSGPTRITKYAAGPYTYLAPQLYERLRSNGVEGSQDEVRLELQHLASHGDITLVFEPSQEAGPTIAGVSSQLCP